MRTRQLIAKIHAQVMPRWEGYQTRRLPITVPATMAQFPTSNPQNPYVQQGSQYYPRAVAWYKLWALRELIRMEMPDRYDDLLFVPTFLINMSPVNGQMQSQPVAPGLKLAYMQRIGAMQGTQVAGVQSIISSTLRSANGPAECLYLLTAVGSNDRDQYAMSFSAAN